MTPSWLRLAFFAAVILILFVLIRSCSPSDSSKESVASRATSFEETWQEVDAPPAPKADKLPVGPPEFYPNLPKLDPGSSHVPPPVAIMPQVVRPARTEGDRFCESYGLHKVVTEGGKSWRCRH